MVPSALIADIAGGAYPAVMNILLALLRRQHSGQGCKLDVSMTDGLFPFLYGAIGTAAATGTWPRPAGDPLSGGSPRYQLYRTKDGRYLAVAPLEEKFWRNFCEAIELPAAAREDRKDPLATIRTVREIIAQRTADEWMARLDGKDVCVNVVGSLQEAMSDPQFRDRGLFSRSVVSADHDALPAVSVPVCEPLRDPRTELKYPRLGEANGMLADPKDEVGAPPARRVSSGRSAWLLESFDLVVDLRELELAADRGDRDAAVQTVLGRVDPAVIRLALIVLDPRRVLRDENVVRQRSRSSGTARTSIRDPWPRYLRTGPRR